MGARQGMCQRCRTRDNLTRDHIIRRSDFRRAPNPSISGKRWNIQRLCRACHDFKEAYYDRGIVLVSDNERFKKVRYHLDLLGMHSMEIRYMDPL